MAFVFKYLDNLGLVFLIKWLIVWKRLNAGTIPANKEYTAGTVPANKEYAAGTSQMSVGAGWPCDGV